MEKRIFAQIKNIGAGNIRGYQIGGALHALKSETANTRRQFNGGRFGYAAVRCKKLCNPQDIG
jgi:hypothetical protein